MDGEKRIDDYLITILTVIIVILLAFSFIMSIQQGKWWAVIGTMIVSFVIFVIFKFIIEEFSNMF